MKNNTKVRLHLSKQLFESLTKQVLAEAKMSKEAMGGGAYTEMVREKKSKAPKFDAYKQPKDQLPTEKKSAPTKAEKGSSEIKKANKERKINEVEPISDTNKMRTFGEVNDREDTEKMQKMHEKMSSKEKMAKGLYKEDMQTADQDKKVTITLDEYVNGDPGMYEIGKWACDMIPALKNIGTSGDIGQTFVDIGTAITSLAGVGTLVATGVIAAHAGEIKQAAKKLVSFISGKKDVKEGANTDQELAQAVAKLPKDVVAKIAQKAGA